MPLIILSLLIQAALIVHVIKTGRNSLWIWAIALLPAAGPIAYVVVELLPGLFAGAAVRRARSGVRKMIDPDRGLRQATAELALSGNVDARRRLAQELYNRGQYERATEVYAAGLHGIFEHDPTLLLGLARAQFKKKDFPSARAALDRLARQNPEFKSADARLLHARALEADGDLEGAEREYAALAPEYPGAEAKFRHGLLLKRRGKFDEARRVFADLLGGAELGPAHYRRAQARWLDRARADMPR